MDHVASVRHLRPVGAGTAGPPAVEPLWREVVGQRLRALRTTRGERLVETAARAGISPQYLSEVERGLKDPSSEVLAAVAGALGTTLVDLTSMVGADLRSVAVSSGARHAGATLALAV